ncbi:hypothetical protein JKF63_07380 [Porcisia hertigi]|uniref:Kinetoplast-associated protein-like protein n=1 Tax=Porcisia hertigi TaxID=2761500 RepID=A0A836LKU6_9TRYP|nr:hypothetical protein JKF63_07380 [Porcisia hertigi]
MLPCTSSRLLQEIKETGKLLRTFRSLKERGASRAELADFHARVKALKLAQQRRQQPDARAHSQKITPPMVTSTAEVEAGTPVTAVKHSVLTDPIGASSHAHRCAGVALFEGSAEWSSSPSSVLRHPQRRHPQRRFEEECAANPYGQRPHGKPHHHRHGGHDVRVDSEAPPFTCVGATTVSAQFSTPILNGTGRASNSGHAGARGAATPRRNATPPAEGSLVLLNSIAFAIVLAEAHLRREIAHRWERRWLRHWANFKEERVAIALRLPPSLAATAAAAALSHPSSERWAEPVPISLPRGRLQQQQVTSAPTAAAEGSHVAATGRSNAIEATPLPVLGCSIEGACSAPMRSVVVENLEKTRSLSPGPCRSDKVSHVAQTQEVTASSTDDTVYKNDAHLGTNVIPRYQEELVALATERVSGEIPCADADASAEGAAAAAASHAMALHLAKAQALAVAAAEDEKMRLATAEAEQFAAAVRNVENDEATARTATESAAVEALKHLRRAEGAARRRAEEARKAVTSLLAAEAETRVTLEGDELRLRDLYSAANRDGVERAVLAAAEARRKEEERLLQEEAARAAAAKNEEEEREREAAVRRAAQRVAAEAQLLGAADTEATERRAIEEQWQADLRRSEALLDGWMRDAIAAAAQRTQSGDAPNPRQTPCDVPVEEDAQSRKVVETQGRLSAQQGAAERRVAAVSAAVDAVLDEWVKAAATDAVAQQRQAEQAVAAAVREAARQRREEEDIAQAKAMMQRRATVERGEYEGRGTLASSEAEAWVRLQQQFTMATEEVRFAAEEKARRCAQQAAAAEEEEASARLKVKMEMIEEAARIKKMEEVDRLQEEKKAAAAAAAAAAAQTATVCSSVANLSRDLVNDCLAEAAQQAFEQRASAAAELVSIAAASAERNRIVEEEAQSHRREEVEGEEAATRCEMYGNALDELKRLGQEASAVARKPEEVEVVVDAEELEPHHPHHHHHPQQQQQHQREQATALCSHLSGLSETLILRFLHDAAAVADAEAACTTTVVKGCPDEAPPASASLDERETEMDAATEVELLQHPSADDGTEEPGASAEETHVSDVDSVEEESCETAADAMAGTPSRPLSRSSSANASPRAVAGGVSYGHVDECWQLPSPTVFVRLADGLLADLLRDVSKEARSGEKSVSGTINEAGMAPADTAQRSTQLNIPPPDGSDAFVASMEVGSFNSASRCLPLQAHQPRSVTLPPTLMANGTTTATGAGGSQVSHVQCAEGEHKDLAGDDAEGSVAEAAAEASTAIKLATEQNIISPLSTSSADANTTTTTTTNTTTWTTSAVRGGGRSGVDGAAGAATAASSSLHCLSTTSSYGDGDDDAVYAPLPAPGVPLPLDLQQHRLLSPLLPRQDGGGGGGGGGNGAGVDTTTTATMLANRTPSWGSSGARQPQSRSLASDGDTATGANNEGISAVEGMSSGAAAIAEDLRAFQLDAPTPFSLSPHDVTEPRADATVVTTAPFSSDTVAAVATSLVGQVVQEAALLAATRGVSAGLNIESEHVTSCGVVKVNLGSPPPSAHSMAPSLEPSTVEDLNIHSGCGLSTGGGGTLMTARTGEDAIHPERKKLRIVEMGPGLMAVDARETTLHISPSSSPAAAAVADEGIAGAHTPLASLSGVVSAVVAPNSLAVQLQQQQAEKRAVAHQQNRYLTNREVARVAARYVTSEEAVTHVREAGPTAALSASAVALVLSVGLVRAVTLENRRARHRVEATGKKSQGFTRGGGDGGGGGGNGFPTDIEKDTSALGRNGDGVVDTFGPPSPSFDGNAASSSGVAAPSPNTAAAPTPHFASKGGKVEDAGTNGNLRALAHLFPLEMASPSSEVALQLTTTDVVEGALTANGAHAQAGVRDRLPSDWAIALRGVAERIASDLMDYASRCILLEQSEGQSNQDGLRTARRIRDDALARVDVRSLFMRDLRPRDVARLVYYYVELAANGPRDRADPNCSPVAFGEHNIFGRRSSGDVDRAAHAAEMGGSSTVSSEGVSSFDHLNPARTNASATPACLQPSSIFSPLLHSRNDSLISAATSVHVRRAGLMQLVLEQCVSNVLHDLTGDTVGWLETIFQSSAPAGGLL